MANFQVTISTENAQDAAVLVQIAEVFLRSRATSLSEKPVESYLRLGTVIHEWIDQLDRFAESHKGWIQAEGPTAVHAWTALGEALQKAGSKIKQGL
ncbi:MAG: hypothetical protein FJ279_19280 [Planctomycetes bacterium]|nr:hypothetical protein [Planctomycetota bacterium]